MATPSFVDYQRGCKLDNAGETSEAIQEFTKAIEKDNYPMAYYCRACIYKDQREFKKAIEDFRSYLKYGSETTPEGTASRVTIEELEIKLKPSSKPQGEKSNVLCPMCKCNLFIVEKNVGGFAGSLKLECPECGQITVKM